MCSPGDSPGLKMGPRRIKCSMRWGWCSLKGSFPDTMAWRMIPLGTQLLQGVVPPKPTHGSCRGHLGYSQAPQISLLTVVLLAHENLWGRVGHRATEGAQQRVLEPHPVGKAKICTQWTSRAGQGNTGDEQVGESGFKRTSVRIVGFAEGGILDCMLEE